MIVVHRDNYLMLFFFPFDTVLYLFIWKMAGILLLQLAYLHFDIRLLNRCSQSCSTRFLSLTLLKLLVVTIKCLFLVKYGNRCCIKEKKHLILSRSI